MSDTPPSTPAAKPIQPPGSRPAPWLYGLLALSWLVPGLGFILAGRAKRGSAHLALVGATFYLGLALHAGVVWPIWEFKSEDFNLIDNIALVAQMGAGLPALLSLWASTKGAAFLNFMAATRQDPYYELGSYFLIVAGALNYFAVGNFYDRIIRVHPRFLEQEFGDKAAS